MKFFLSAFLIVFNSMLSVAQAPSIEWQRCFGGSRYDIGIAVLNSSMGGYLIGGIAESTDGDVIGNHGGPDVWILKLSQAGDIEWQKCYGGSHIEGGLSLMETLDGGYLFATSTHSNDGDVLGNHGDCDGWVVKISNTGAIEWQKTYGGSAHDFISTIRQTSDGGYVFVGSTWSVDMDLAGIHLDPLDRYNFWVVKLSSSGVIEWQKVLGGTFVENPYDILQSQDGGYYVTGGTQSNDGDVSGKHGSADGWVVRLSPVGEIIWQKCLGGSMSDCFIRQQLTESGVIEVGQVFSNDGDVSGSHGSSDTWVVSLSATGNIVWQKCLGGSGQDDPWMIETLKDGYIISGWSESIDGDITGNHGKYDVWLIKISFLGNIDWQKSLGGSSDDIGYGVIQTPDSGYIVIGATWSNDGDVSGNHGERNFWVVKLKMNTGVISVNSQQLICTITPNPTKGKLAIKTESDIGSLTISDMLGRVVYENYFNCNNLNLDISDLPNGPYLVRINESSVQKLFKY